MKKIVVPLVQVPDPIGEILADRGARYGKFEDHARDRLRGCAK